MIDTLSNSAHLQSILAVARTGSPSAAATQLALQPSTLYRHLEAAEAAAGSALFLRRKGVWKPTLLGTRLVELAADVENKLRDFALEASAQGKLSAGVLRVTVSDADANFYLAGRLAAFHAKHPRLAVELIVTNRRMDLANGEADIALRTHSQPGDGLVGRRVGRMLHAVYGSECYLSGRQTPRSDQELSGHQLIAYGHELAHFSAARWTTQVLRGASAVARFNDVTAMARAVEGGLGLAALPCHVGVQLKETRRLFATGNGLPTDIWILTHESQKRSVKAKAFIRHFSAMIKHDAPLFEGQRLKISR